jgi:hypothetical protein
LCITSISNPTSQLPGLVILLANSTNRNKNYTYLYTYLAIVAIARIVLKLVYKQLVQPLASTSSYRGGQQTSDIDVGLVPPVPLSRGEYPPGLYITPGLVLLVATRTYCNADSRERDLAKIPSRHLEISGG